MNMSKEAFFNMRIVHFFIANMVIQPVLMAHCRSIDDRDVWGRYFAFAASIYGIGLNARNLTTRKSGRRERQLSMI